MRFTKLSEPSDIVLEQILFATSRQEQLAIIGRAAMHMGLRSPNAAIDVGVQSERYLKEARRRGVSPEALAEMVVAYVVARDLFSVVLDVSR